ncbi:natural killer cells antigen CD94-like [Ornithorhynchus anatinus]|uniref:Natural killer cells antigen CD94 n=1 Tax=Ornithorhynchus anatinus TaxID=9258 RepID=F7EQL0_ORNAN|nr:natural killer cells antigen CD94-like [Ornithorhynchus anatinus]
MSKQQETYAELNRERLRRPLQERRSKGSESKKSAREQSVTYSELTLRNRPQPCDASESAQNKVDSSTTKWRHIAVTLGICSLVLLVTTGFLAAQINWKHRGSSHASLNITDWTSPNPGGQKGCNRGLCPDAWVGFRNSCYHFWNDEKSWEDGRRTCTALNASLLQIDDQEERDFLALFTLYGWIGLSRDGAGGSWQWRDGTALSSDLLTLTKTEPDGDCAVYGVKNIIYNRNCMKATSFICEQQIP